MSEALLDPTAIGRGLRRVAVEIAERGRGVGDLALVGIRRDGEPIAARLATLLHEIEGARPLVGSVDITLYRDDAARASGARRIASMARTLRLEDRQRQGIGAGAGSGHRVEVRPIPSR